MNRYVLEERIGEGTFGTVYRAKKKEDPGKHYAIKKLKQRFSSWKDVLIEREFEAIVALMANGNKKRQRHHGRATKVEDEHCLWDHSHHLVRVYEVLREEDSCLYFAMEYMASGSLHDYIAKKSRQKMVRSGSSQDIRNSPSQYTFDDTEARSILFQAFRGLCHVHSRGLVHRDVKPENILLEGRIAKLADFSLTRPISAKGTISCLEKSGIDSQSAHELTNYVGTRWYRAPELLRPNNVANGTSCYSTVIDVFSMGCVAAELYRCSPLFQGRDEKEQIQLIEELLLLTKPPFAGTNNFLASQDVSEQVVKSRLEAAVPTSDPRAIQFLSDVLQFRPESRADSEMALRHAYFEREYYEATIENENEVNPTLTNILRARRMTKQTSTLGLPESIETRKWSPPPAAGNTTGAPNKTIQLQTLSSVRITPNATGGSMGIRRFSKTTSFKRKRQKLRPSQIFNIDEE